tara:strand:+ start:1090 stop:1416 length:327 start_codon:yes stop_codon:yes gene_type:complete
MIKIKISGTHGSGVSTVEYQVIKALRNLGHEVEFVPDPNFENEYELTKAKESAPYAHKIIKVETEQLPRDWIEEHGTEIKPIDTDGKPMAHHFKPYKDAVKSGKFKPW